MSAKNRKAESRQDDALGPHVLSAWDELRGHSDWPGYAFSASGHVFSFKRWRGPYRRLAEGRDMDGYVTAQVTKHNKTTPLVVHRWLCRIFHGEKLEPHHQVRHLDGDPDNNRVANLAWGSVKDNADDREAHGRTARGERSNRGKLTELHVRQIKSRVSAGEVQLRLAAEYGVCSATINHIMTGRIWAHVS